MISSTVNDPNKESQQSVSISLRRAYAIVSVLCLINLLNYVDRQTISAVLDKIQIYYGINDATAGLLQASFMCAYMIFAPLFGYLGDRYSRKWIMFIGISIWSSTVMISSFAGPTSFWAFILGRSFVGIGEASYSTVSPTIIADLFTSDKRSIILMLFYFAIPVGSGLGFIVADLVASAMGTWQWGIRITPFFGIFCLVLLYFVVVEPERGVVELGSVKVKARTFKEDIVHLLHNKSFMWCTLGFTCLSFTTGGIVFWVPTFIKYSRMVQNLAPEGISFMFGIMTCLSGFLGVAVGTIWSTRWRRTNPRADPLVCGFGVLFAMPCYFLFMTFATSSLSVIYAFVFLTCCGMSLNWSLTVDIAMYVVIPTCRSTANGVLTLIGHLLGDAFSGYIIGAISDHMRGDDVSHEARFRSLGYAMYIPVVHIVLATFFYFGTAWFLVEDKKKADEEISALSKTASTTGKDVKFNDLQKAKLAVAPNESFTVKYLKSCTTKNTTNKSAAESQDKKEPQLRIAKSNTEKSAGD